MIRTRGANRTLHRIIRGIVLLNFILLVVDSNALPSFQDLIRRNQFVTPLSYWVEISILSVIGLLLVQPILRAYQRAKTPKDSLTLIDKAFLADLLLLLLWITALFVAAARSGQEPRDSRTWGRSGAFSHHFAEGRKCYNIANKQGSSLSRTDIQCKADWGLLCQSFVLNSGFWL